MVSDMAEQFDLIIIGGGSGGYVSAIEASKKGMKTALIERDKLGGTCLNRGCIPTKTLLHSAELYDSMRSCEMFGVQASDVSFDMEKIQGRKEEVISQLRGGIELLMKKNKVTVYCGQGTIESEHEVSVHPSEGEEKILLEGKNILISTGSVPAIPPILGHDLENVVSSDELLDKKTLYPRLTIVGGGVIGMEFASVYSALGCQVTVVEFLDRILANMDKEISQNLKMIMKKRGVDIHTGAKVERITKEEDGTLSCHFTEKDCEKSVVSDGILIATGRRANTEGLFGAGFSLDMDRGRILVNEVGQTSVPNIYAAGDVVPGIQLAHAASAQGLRAIEHMWKGTADSIRIDLIPGCVYTDPEIGSVGLTQEEAKTQGLSVIVKKYPMSANGKSLLSNQERGFIKVVADGETHKVLGAQMMCARATDMISEFGTAIVNGLTLEQMAAVVRPHPTFSEGISEAVSAV